MKKIILSSAVFLLALNVSAQQKMLQIKGSDTLVNTVQILAENFMATNKGKVISVTGGGSGTGFACLKNATCDIANASRTIKDSEKVAGKEFKAVVIGIDGLSIVVNKANKVSKLTIEQLKGIFTGAIKNWKELGGADLPISLYGRQANSGTYDYFKEHVLNKQEYINTVREMNGNAQIVDIISNTASGIGYVGAAYTTENTKIKVLEVAESKNKPYFLPTTKNIKEKKYPISRPLFQYVAAPINPDTLAFIKYELSAIGQKTVEEEGFFSITEEYKKENIKTIGK